MEGERPDTLETMLFIWKVKIMLGRNKFGEFFGGVGVSVGFIMLF